MHRPAEASSVPSFSWQIRAACCVATSRIVVTDHKHNVTECGKQFAGGKIAVHALHKKCTAQLHMHVLCVSIDQPSLPSDIIAVPHMFLGKDILGIGRASAGVEQVYTGA